jgi:glycine/D-amino acid oxidase-like deaminating enzyme
MTHYDVIVLGGGTMGLAAAWELARRGRRALVLSNFRWSTIGGRIPATRASFDTPTPRAPTIFRW